MNIAVRSNLYSEARAQRRKVAVRHLLVSAALLLFSAACGFWWLTNVELAALREEYTVKKGADASLEQDLSGARAKADRRKADAVQRDVILRYASTRTNFAPVLESLFAGTPANVEFSRLQIDASAAGGGTVKITGRSTGAQPRLECDKCRLLLADAVEKAGFTVTATFAKLEDSPDTVHFEETEYPTADFVIEMKLTPGVRHDGET